MNRVLIPLLTKLAAPKPHEWYKYLEVAQLYLNSKLHRSIGMTLFRVLLGVHPRIRDNPDVKELLQSEMITSFDDDREELRKKAQENIEKIQRENKASYNKKKEGTFYLS